MRFQVFVNGEQKCIAGFQPHGALSVNLTWVSRDPSLYEKFASRYSSKKQFTQPYTHLLVGGSPGNKGDFWSWYTSDQIKPGDEITIKVLEPGPADDPAKTERIQDMDTELADFCESSGDEGEQGE